MTLEYEDEPNDVELDRLAQEEEDPDEFNEELYYGADLDVNREDDAGLNFSH